MEIAIITGSRLAAIMLSSAVNRAASFGPSAPTMKGTTVPGTYCFGTYTPTLRVYGAGWLVIIRRGRASAPAGTAVIGAGEVTASGGGGAFGSAPGAGL